MNNVEPRQAVILTSLPVEYRAVRAHLSNCREEEHNEGTVYERGIFQGEAGSWSVGIVEVGDGEAAPFEAERAIAHFKPSIVMFVGLADGLQEVSIGDVVSATKIYGYESGVAGNSFEPRPDVGETSYLLEQRARAEAKKDGWLLRAETADRARPEQDKPTLASGQKSQVKVGPIAAGPKILNSTQSAAYQFLRSHYEDALAAETGGRGFLKATRANKVAALVVRGISKIIGSEEQVDVTASRELAARHAAAFAFEVLAHVALQTQAGSTSRRPSDVSDSNEVLASIRRYTELSLAELNSVGSRRTDSGALEKVCLSDVYCQRVLLNVEPGHPDVVSRKYPYRAKRQGSSSLEEVWTSPKTHTEAALLDHLRDAAGSKNDVAPNSVAGGRWVSIIADAGYGKSSLLHWLCSNLLVHEHELQTEVLFLQARDFPTRNMEATEERLAPGLDLKAPAFLPGWPHPDQSLRQVLESLNAAGSPPIIVLDTLDFLIGRLELETVKSFLESLKKYCCVLLTTCRRKEHDDLCRRLIPPDQTLLLEPFEARVKQLAVERHIDVFYAERSDNYRSRQKTKLVSLGENSRFARIFSNPLLTRMTFEVFAPDLIPEDLDTRRIYGAYWAAKVDREATRFSVRAVHLQAQTQPAKVLLTLSLAHQMLRFGQPSVAGELAQALNKEVDDRYGSGIGSIAQRDLTSENVLLPSATLRPIEFFHQTFFEYAAARYVADDPSLGRFRILRDYLQHHRDSVRLPVLMQSVLLIAESQGTLSQLDGASEPTASSLVSLLDSLWNRENLVEIGFEVVAKSAVVPPEVSRRVEELVELDPKSANASENRRKFLLALRLFDDAKLRDFTPLLTRLFVQGSLEEKEQWMEPLSSLAADCPRSVSSLISSWKSSFSAQTLQHNHVGHYLREIYTRLAEHSPTDALNALKEWLEDTSVPWEGRRFIIGALAPCASEQGDAVLQLLYEQAAYAKKPEQREALAQVAALCPEEVFQRVFPSLLSDLSCEAFNRAILAAMLLAQAPKSVLEDQLKRVAQLFLDSDPRHYEQMAPLFKRFCRDMPLDWWNQLTPVHFLPGENSTAIARKALNLMASSSQTTPVWREWLLAGLGHAMQSRNATAHEGGAQADQKLASHLAALRVLWDEDWLTVIHVASCLELDNATDSEMCGAVGACDVMPDNDQQAEAIHELLLRIVQNTNNRRTFNRIMDVATQLCERWPHHAQGVGETFIAHIRDEHRNAGEAGKRLTPLSELIEALAKHHPVHAIHLAEQVEDLPQANIQRACANAYLSLATENPFLSVEWASRQVQANPVVMDIAASAVVVALKAASDDQLSDSNAPLYQRVVEVIPLLGRQSNECGVKMIWACVRLAQRGHASKAWDLLTQFMDGLSTRGVFCVRDAVDAIVTAEGTSILSAIRDCLQGAPYKIQVAIIQGLAKSPCRRVLSDIYAQTELDLSYEVRNMLNHLIHKHEVNSPSQTVEMDI